MGNSQRLAKSNALCRSFPQARHGSRALTEVARLVPSGTARPRPGRRRPTAAGSLASSRRASLRGIRPPRAAAAAAPRPLPRGPWRPPAAPGPLGRAPRGPPPRRPPPGSARPARSQSYRSNVFCLPGIFFNTLDLLDFPQLSISFFDFHALFQYIVASSSLSSRSAPVASRSSARAGLPASVVYIYIYIYIHSKLP